MTSDLFGEEPGPQPFAMPPAGDGEGDGHDGVPLAERLRPSTLDEMLGQSHLLGPKSPLRRLIEADRVPSMILWGPPGCGKTTLARLIAQHVAADFITLSAVTSSIRDVRATVDVAKGNRKYGRRTILFIDEIHRFNKAQQDAFLPHVESGVITLIGATTENPSFSVIAPLLSRCRVFTLEAHPPEVLAPLVRRGVARLNDLRLEGETEIHLDEGAQAAVVAMCDGDARRALGLLEIVVSVKRTEPGLGSQPVSITAEEVAAIAQRHFVYDKSGEEHFNLISALHKTLRSSDPHGAAYWLERMLASGEDPRYLARRMIRFASEDIGLADPNALWIAMECFRAFETLGMPEGGLALHQCAIYLAMAPKSNAVYTTRKAVAAEIERSGSLPVPLHLRNAPTGLMKNLGYGRDYTYDHDAEGAFIAKQGLPDALAGTKFYQPGTSGREKALGERLAELDRLRDGE